MRVLLAVHAFPPRSCAGTEIYTLRLGTALVALGHEVEVLTAVHDLADRHGRTRRRAHEGLAVTEVVSNHAAGTLEATYRDPEIARAAEAAVDAFAPDVLHVQHFLNLSTGIAARARARGARVVMTLHDHWLGCPRDGLRMRADLTLCGAIDHRACGACLADSPYLAPAAQRVLGGAARRVGVGRALHRAHRAAPRMAEGVMRALRAVSPRPRGLESALDARADHLRATASALDLLVAPTRFVHDRAVEWGAPAGRVAVRSYGAIAGPTRARRPGPRKRMAYLGTLAPHKGVHVLVDAFRRVADPAATLDLFGAATVAPSYAAELRRAAGDDTRIRFRGAFAEGDQPRILAFADLVVIPSIWWENSPLVALEAMAEGVPVVASAIGGLPEIVPDGAGVLVPPRDAEALAAVLGDAASGRVLGEALPPLALKTVEAGALEMVELYRRAAS